MNLLKNSNKAVSFLLELAMLAAFAYFGFVYPADAVVRWVVGLGLPAVTIVAWAVVLAPASPRRFGMTLGLAVSTVLFLLAAILLLVCNQVVLGVILGVISLGNRFLTLKWEQWQPLANISLQLTP